MPNYRLEDIQEMEKVASKNGNHRWRNSGYFANRSHDMMHFDDPPNNDNPQCHFTASQQPANYKGDGVITAKDDNDNNGKTLRGVFIFLNNFLLG